MGKEECGCDCEGDHHHHHEISTDDIAKHNHLVLNAIVKVLIDKKLIEADDINKAAVEIQNMAREKNKKE